MPKSVKQFLAEQKEELFYQLLKEESGPNQQVLRNKLYVIEREMKKVKVA
jgi:hypothetical protein